MKYETLMLHSLFIVCLLVCAAVLGSMLTARPTIDRTLAIAGGACTTTAASCPLPRG